MRTGTKTSKGKRNEMKGKGWVIKAWLDGTLIHDEHCSKARAMRTANKLQDAARLLKVSPQLKISLTEAET